MSIKYLTGESAGSAFEVIEGIALTVSLANEGLDKASGLEGEEIIYTVTIKDAEGAALPVTFVADLLIDDVKLIEGQTFDATVYDPVTFLLTLPWTVPALPGNHLIKLSWAEQTI